MNTDALAAQGALEALAGALCCMVHAVTGFTNKSLRGLVAGLFGAGYSAHQMTYDLRRLRLHGLITRVPHTNTYVVTPEGIRTAVFFTKVHSPSPWPGCIGTAGRR